ncbi:hypothetical protein F4823DRAFT_634502 [Ustulina deusta]|nr:hypothetical protein F4823DRAFT_634502 [Ustulina deusta]
MPQRRVLRQQWTLRFCGSTSDFCGNGCQDGFGSCVNAPKSSCSSSNANKRTIGYYESWASTRKCQFVRSPLNLEDLNLNGFTHVNFAFAFFDPTSFEIAPMDSNSATLYRRFTSLKESYSGFQTWISVGGWSFTDPGPTRQAFSDMASSSTNRQKFISSIKSFMNTYGFDGLDIDWEYPGADDRGGVQADSANFVTLVKELKESFGSKGLTVTLPTSYWYLQHLGCRTMFNLMAYDLHGTWDADSQFVGPYIAPHTNLSEIDQGLGLLWRASVESSKVVLGQGWYGRSFTLKDPSCNEPNGVCQFSGGAEAGPCSGTSGILDYQEIEGVIDKYSPEVVWDKEAGWISYDDDDTFAQKKSFATDRCLGGLMVWAIDQKDQSSANNLVSGVSDDQQNNAKQSSADQAAKLSCYTTDCDAECKMGTNQVAQMNGQPGKLSTKDRCPAGQYRNLCCNDGTKTGKCQWRGYHGLGMSCISGCAKGETELVTDTSSHSGSKDQTCNGGLQSYCCSDFKAPPTKSNLLSKAGDAVKDAAEAAAEQLALDVAANAFCRVAVPALLAPLELIEDLIPFIGWIATAAEIAATPALIRLCVKGIEKEGKAEFKVFGKNKSLTLDTKTKPVSTRPPSSSHKAMPTSTANCKRADGDNCGRPWRDGPPLYEKTASATIEPAPTVSVCDGSRWQQPCLHYSSVIQNNPAYQILKCPLVSRASPARPWRDRWYNDHNADWYSGFMKDYSVKCQADEYPPAAFWQGAVTPKQYICFAPGRQNGGAGSLFGLGFCGYDNQGNLPVERVNERYVSDRVVGGLRRVTQYMARTTRRAVQIDFIGVADPDGVAGLNMNPCWPEILLEDPGFALLTDDRYYAGHRDAQRKRDEKSYGLDPEAWVFDDGNSTRRVTKDELVRYLGILRCESADCHEEMQELGIKSAPVVEAAEASHHPAVPTTFASRTQSASDVMATDVSGEASAGSRAAALLATPTQTGL